MSSTRVTPHINTINSLSTSDRIQLLRVIGAMANDLADLRTKYAALQTALNAGTAPGAGGYPNATMAPAASQVNQL